MKKLSFFILIGVLLGVYGCNTVKGAGFGAAAVAQGVGKDVSTGWDKAKKADDWLQKNAW